MSKAEVRRLKPGDRVRLKASGAVILVTGKEDSGRIVYGTLHAHPGGAILSLKADEVRQEERGQ